ncbi:MAG: glycosyltransferase [Rhizobacter sp.]|nr:glycosyltransferase [Bacteriovorax sp.]
MLTGSIKLKADKKIVNYILCINQQQLWQSCNYHHKKLIDLYNSSLSIEKIISCQAIDKFDSPFFTKILQANYDRCRFIITSPQINFLSLSRFLQKFKNTHVEINIHLYGNLFREQNHLIALLKLAESRNWKVKLISPTETFSITIKKILNANKGIFTIPLFKQPLSSEKKITLLEDTNSDQFKIGYAGRITEDKNLHSLLLLFKDKLIYEKYTLFVAGSFDSHIYTKRTKNLQTPYLFLIAEIYRSLSDEAKGRIHFLGDLDRGQLAYFYKKINLCINLSTFYGEVFGLSTAEALSSGCQVLTTKWGGLNDLNTDKHNLVNVKISSMGRTSVDLEDLTKKLLMIKNKRVKKVIKNDARSTQLIADTLMSSESVASKKKYKILNRKQWSLVFSKATI